MMVFSGFDDAVVVDVETTGLDPTRDRIVSVAMIRARFSKLRQRSKELYGDTIDAIVNPQCRIPARASRIHGIRDKDVRNEKPFAEIAHKLRDFIAVRPIIAHNASFDKSFLNAEFKRAGVKTLARNRSYCTMRRFQDFNHGLRRGSNLDNVADVMGVSARKSTRHEATDDVRIVWEVAGLFYMMDNRIRIPGGKPKPLPRSKQHSQRRAQARQDQDDANVGCGAMVLVIAVIALLYWLFT